MRYATASNRAVQAGASGPLRSTSNKHKAFWVPNHPILSSPLASQPTPLSGGQLVLGIRQRVTQLLLCSGQQRFDVLEFHTAQRELAHKTFLDVSLWLETHQELLLWCVCFRLGVLWFGIHSSRTILTHNDPLSLPHHCVGGGGPV